MLFLPSHMNLVITAEACHAYAFPSKAASAVPQTHFLRISKHKEVGQRVLPHKPIPGHGPCSPGSCTWLKLTCIKQMYTARQGKNALDLLVPSFLLCVGASPVRAGSAVLGCSGEIVMKGGYRSLYVPLCGASVGRCVWICSLLKKTKQKKSTWVSFYLLFLGLCPQTVLERAENRICYSL